MEPRRWWEKCRVLALCAGMCEMWCMHGSRSNVPRATHHPATQPPSQAASRTSTRPSTYRARGASGPPHIVPVNFHLCPQPQAKRQQQQQQQQESQQRTAAEKKLSSGCKMSAKTFSKLFTRLPFCFLCFFFRSLFSFFTAGFLRHYFHVEAIRHLLSAIWQRHRQRSSRSSSRRRPRRRQRQLLHQQPPTAYPISN